MSETIYSGTALAVIPRAELIFVSGGAKEALETIRKHTLEQAARLDVSRPKDRDAIKSLAYRVARLKTTGDDAGKKMKAEYQAKITPIDAERRIWRDGMDALADEVRKPVDDLEAAEAAERAAHEAAIEDIRLIGMPPPGISSAELTRFIDELAHLHPIRQWGVFQDRATEARRNAHNALVVACGEAVKREAAEAEAQRLAAEEAARAQAELERLRAEREAEIASRAAEGGPGGSGASGG
jgi:colicin import membrane protein